MSRGRYRIIAALAFGLAAPRVAAQSAVEHYDLKGAPAWRADMLVALTEISGLAVDGGLVRVQEGVVARRWRGAGEDAVEWVVDPAQGPDLELVCVYEVVAAPDVQYRIV